MVLYGELQYEPLWGRILIKCSHLLLTLSSAVNIVIYSYKVMEQEQEHKSRSKDRSRSKRRSRSKSRSKSRSRNRKKNSSWQKYRVLSVQKLWNVTGQGVARSSTVVELHS